MANALLKDVGKVLLKGGEKVVVGIITPKIEKWGDELVEKHKSLIKIPDLKDVRIDEALRVLKDELNLIPTSAIAKPCLAYADESENEVMYSEPRFGSRVNPRTTVKVFYLTQEVIDKSKELLENKVQDFKIPRVIGLNIYEAREDLECLGLKITEKVEKPSLKFAGKEDDQVTRVTSPNGQKIGLKLKAGDRVWIYYVNEEVISKSKSIKDEKAKDKQEIIDKIEKNIKKPFIKKKASSDKIEE